MWKENGTWYPPKQDALATASFWLVALAQSPLVAPVLMQHQRVTSSLTSRSNEIAAGTPTTGKRSFDTGRKVSRLSSGLGEQRTAPKRSVGV